MERLAFAVTAPVALVEAIDRDGQVRQAWRVERWPLSIGRAIDNDVVLSDPHVAAHHLVLREVPEVGLALAVGETANGVGLGTRLAEGGTTVALSSLPTDARHALDLRVGRTQLRVRLAGETVPPETRLSRVALREPRAWPTAVAALVLLGAIAFGTWLDNDPEPLPRVLGGTLLAAVFVGAVWAGLWALLSKTFTRQSRFGWHVRVFVLGSLAVIAIGWVSGVGAFALSWPWLSDFAFVAVYAAVATAIWHHLVAVEPARERTLRAVVVSGFVGAVALSIWLNVQRIGRPGEDLYLHRLMPPAVRLARPVPVDDFVGRLGADQAVLDRQAKERSGDGGDDEGDDRE